MNKREREQLDHLTRILIGWGFNASDIGSLRRIERKLHRLGERQCNGEGWGPREWVDGRSYPRWTDKDEAQAEREEKRLAGRAQAICDKREGNEAKAIGRIIAYHQGDPRGGALVLVPESKLAGRDINSLYSSVGVYV